MPQFDPTLFAPQVFWLIVSFVTLYVLMATLALPRIGAILDERQRRIDDDLDRAQRLKAEAEVAVATFERAMTDSRAEAAGIVKERADEATSRSEQRGREEMARLTDRVHAAEAEILGAKKTAMAEIRTLTVDLAAVAIERLIGGAAGASRGDIEAAVEAAFLECGR